MYHDTHAHLELLLQKQGYLPEGRELELDILEKDGVEFEVDERVIHNLLAKHDWLIQATISTGNFRLVFEMLRHITKVYFLLGSHPEIVDEKFDLNNYLDKQRDLLLDLERVLPALNRVVGVGECGLDYHYTQNQDIWSQQKALFESQIQLAQKLNLPLVIHCREAFSDLFEILNEYPQIHGHFLVHCFTAGADELKKIVDLGGKVGIGGVLTFNSAKHLQEAMTYAPEDCFVLETDLPFLAPVPHRGEICLPEYIDLIAEKLAVLRNVKKEQIWHSSTQNSIHLFGQL